MKRNDDDRVHTRMPRAELDRRHALLRAHLKERGLDALVVLASDDFLGGYVRWLIDRPAYNAYHVAAVIYPDDLLTLVEHGGTGGRRASDGADPDFPGVGEILTTAAFRSVHYLHGAEGDLVKAALRRRGCKRIGFAGLGALPHRFVTTIAEIPGVVISDESDALDQFKAVKSDAEIDAIRATTKMQDEIFAHVLAHARPGMRDIDIAALAQAEGRRRGSEGGVIFCGSAPPGQPAVMRVNHWQMRTIEQNDAVTLLIENNGPEGYYAELGRTFVFGRAEQSLKDALALACEAQSATVAQLVPGVACADIAAKHDTILARAGLPPETRLYAHGQGYDLVERPLVRADEPGRLEAGMCMVVHPAFVTPSAFGYVCDNYLVGADGPSACLHQTAKTIFEIV